MVELAEELEDEEVDEIECFKCEPDFDLEDDEESEEDSEEEPEEDVLVGYDVSAMVDEDNIELAERAE